MLVLLFLLHFFLEKLLVLLQLFENVFVPLLGLFQLLGQPLLFYELRVIDSGNDLHLGMLLLFLFVDDGRVLCDLFRQLLFLRDVGR